MPDGQEESINLFFDDLLSCFSLILIKLKSCHNLVALHLFGLMFPEYLDILRIKHTFLHGLGSTQLITAYNQVYLLANTSQVSSLFCCSISSAHNSHHLILVEEAVACGTGRNTIALELLLRLKSQVFSRGTGGQDYTIRLDQDVLINMHLLHLSGEIHLGSHTKTHLCAKTFCLLLQILHHGRTISAFRIAGKIINFSGGG